MRFMLRVRANQARAQAVRAFNTELVRAGVMLAADGLEAEPIDGHWIIQAKSREEAAEWARRAPFAAGEIEVQELVDAGQAAGR